MRNLIAVVVVVWLLIGVVAAFQRGYLTGKKSVHCHTVGDTVLTVIAGPLDYLGVNPKVSCHVPQPSK